MNAIATLGLLWRYACWPLLDVIAQQCVFREHLYRSHRPPHTTLLKKRTCITLPFCYQSIYDMSITRNTLLGLVGPAAAPILSGRRKRRRSFASAWGLS